MEKAKLLEILNKITLFQGMDERELKVILNMPKVYEVFAPGETIVREGDVEACFYILLAGKAKVIVKEQTLAQIGPPQFVGEVGFICKEPRIATVIANEEVKAMRLDAANFSRLPVSIRETIKDKIIAGLVSRLARVNESVANYKCEPVTKTSLDESYAESELI